jgi:hypothetical protein
MAVEALASLVGVVEENFDNFWARAAEFRAQPQLRVAKRTITANLDEAKR